MTPPKPATDCKGCRLVPTEPPKLPWTATAGILIALAMGALSLVSEVRQQSGTFVTQTQYEQDEAARREMRDAIRDEMRLGFARVEAELATNRKLLTELVATVPRKPVRISADVVERPD